MRNRGPLRLVGRMERYLVIAVTGQMCAPVPPVDSVTPEQKGSVFDTLKWICMYMGLYLEGWKVMSWV